MFLQELYPFLSVFKLPSVLLMGVTRVPGETTDLPQVADKLTNCGDVYIYMHIYVHVSCICN
jgi:hypothetical protein